VLALILRQLRVALTWYLQLGLPISLTIGLAVATAVASFGAALATFKFAGGVALAAGRFALTAIGYAVSAFLVMTAIGLALSVVLPSPSPSPSPAVARIPIPRPPPSAGPPRPPDPQGAPAEPPVPTPAPTQYSRPRAKVPLIKLLAIARQGDASTVSWNLSPAGDPCQASQNGIALTVVPGPIASGEKQFRASGTRSGLIVISCGKATMAVNVEGT